MTLIKNLAEQVDEEFCQLLYEIAVNAYSKFNWDSNPKEATGNMYFTKC
jgi:hypothetical protein